MTFPDGWSGLALVAMRLSLVGVLAASPFSNPFLPSWALAAADSLALVLALGVFTRISAAMAVPVTLGAGLMIGGAPGGMIALHGLDAAALALLGAGAYSIDALIFGRRVIRLDH